MRHRFHALCPYFAMFPESFVETWVNRLTSPGDVVLDPFSGRGTTAFQSLLMQRRAIACDVNDVAVCLTRAKTSAPLLRSVLHRISQLERGFDGRGWWREAKRQPEFFGHAFASETLRQLLYLRASLRWKRSPVDSMVAALVLGSLHGEMDKSDSYLSNQMPRTISTKPAYSVRYWRERDLTPPRRDVFAVISQRAGFRYATPPPQGQVTVLHRDMRSLPSVVSRLPRPVRCVITSPPYFDVTNFEEDQWLRLWFLGGPPFPTKGRLSQDDRHCSRDSYRRFISDMWAMLARVTDDRAHVVVRIGCSRIEPADLTRFLVRCSQSSNRDVELVSAEVSEIKNRQTDRFRPGSRGCLVEVDCHFRFRS